MPTPHAQWNSKWGSGSQEPAMVTLPFLVLKCWNDDTMTRTAKRTRTWGFRDRHTDGAGDFVSRRRRRPIRNWNRKIRVEVGVEIQVSLSSSYILILLLIQLQCQRGSNSRAGRKDQDRDFCALVKDEATKKGKKNAHRTHEIFSWNTSSLINQYFSGSPRVLYKPQIRDCKLALKTKRRELRM